MPKGTVTLSKRRGGSVPMPVLQAQAKAGPLDVTLTNTGQLLGIVAESDDDFWELAFDTNVRVHFAENPTVTATSGRLLCAGIPYTYAAKEGQKIAVILA
ncbi:hypothetical protein MRBLMR1_004885 [Neorhizobium sp. LMR1-1-1.1]